MRTNICSNYNTQRGRSCKRHLAALNGTGESLFLFYYYPERRQCWAFWKCFGQKTRVSILCACFFFLFFLQNSSWLSSLNLSFFLWVFSHRWRPAGGLTAPPGLNHFRAEAVGSWRAVGSRERCLDPSRFSSTLGEVGTEHHRSASNARPRVKGYDSTFWPLLWSVCHAWLVHPGTSVLNAGRSPIVGHQIPDCTWL